MRLKNLRIGNFYHARRDRGLFMKSTGYISCYRSFPPVKSVCVIRERRKSAVRLYYQSNTKFKFFFRIRDAILLLTSRMRSNCTMLSQIMFNTSENCEAIPSRSFIAGLSNTNGFHNPRWRYSHFPHRM